MSAIHGEVEEMKRDLTGHQVINFLCEYFSRSERLAGITIMHRLCCCESLAAHSTLVASSSSSVMSSRPWILFLPVGKFLNFLLVRRRRLASSSSGGILGYQLHIDPFNRLPLSTVSLKVLSFWPGGGGHQQYTRKTVLLFYL